MSTTCTTSPRFEMEIGAIDDVDPDPFSFVEIPAGSFLMGGSEQDRFVSAIELPQQEITMEKPFAIGRSPVTVAEWSRCCGYPDKCLVGSCFPAVSLTYREATSYADWMSEMTGRKCRLPTETEWEYASRGGRDGLFPSGRNSISPNEANYLYSERGNEVGRGHITAIGSYSPNGYGLYDMSGNICEWTSSLWTSSFLESAEFHRSRRVIKGGGWDQLPRTMRCSWRDWAAESTRCDNLGFRILVELDDASS